MYPFNFHFTKTIDGQCNTLVLFQPMHFFFCKILPQVKKIVVMTLTKASLKKIELFHQKNKVFGLGLPHLEHLLLQITK